MVAYNTTAVRSNSNVTSYARIHTQNTRTVTNIMSRNFQAMSSQRGIDISQRGLSRLPNNENKNG